MQLIDYLAEQLRNSANFNSAVQIEPAAILWTDIECQWQSAMPAIKQYLPELVELGEYKPEERIGPAIWIKCAIAGVLEECELPKGRIPIIYLPGVGRKDLRAIEQCPDHLRPLAELQYRGCWWAYNTAGRDWSVGSFLTNPRVGLALDVAKDKKTQAAILKILPDLLETPDESLRGKKLEAQDFINIVMNDPAKDILGWLNNPADKKALWKDSKWPIFKQACLDNYGFDPDKTPLDAVLFKLCESEGEWQAVWQRFEDTAHNLPLLVECLTTIQPDGLAFNASHFLAENDKDENELATALQNFSDKDVNTIKKQLVSLFELHADRKSWLWYTLDLAPWLTILEQLTLVVEHTSIAFTGPTVEVMANTYQERFWQADAAAIQAMAVTKDINQQQVVADILAVIYSPWLEQVTLNFQNLVRAEGYPGKTSGSGEVQESTAQYNVGSQVVFFVDGLRFDTAKTLQQKLNKLSVSTNLKTNWCALPSLTATAKAAVTPVAELLIGAQENDNFTPMVASSGSEFSSYHLKKSLADKGWQYLEGLETGEPTGTAWVQTGDLDNMGHKQQMKMPLNIDAVLEDVVARVDGLLKAGWKNIRIVTDHGWLWVPNKLAEANISKNIVKKRLARCAILKDNIDTAELKVPWHWNENVSVAMAPGISGYVAGDYYNHGGLSLQECLTPVINICSKG
ncbi:BREX-1 system phosphatase PglZ type B [Colwellia hornerae]|uniref:BREX-1 system phosphatase PglZ type B n=1 Tax=Colwellia hornerae TaxID=89402 RepID=A0A5C6QFE0_9GAMM|nr:BREX-1 system phosphatase PglZ type B [Colwellia hornerae]TWX52635.1 BREX-1 system phosphatase PglZ type B [Colwellia hornerae]TWX58398.1 BREX-1 system phosphatase PglZ type B [Colwellia hornerae]TWX67450.1 BREX-1 system phosphatase PglZ type B [Colwellia hornerae]